MMNMKTQLLSMSLSQHDFVHRTRGTGVVPNNSNNNNRGGGQQGGGLFQ